MQSKAQGKQNIDDRSKQQNKYRNKASDKQQNKHIELVRDLHEALNAPQGDPAINELHEVPRQHGDRKPEQVEQRQCWEGYSRSQGISLCCVHGKGCKGYHDGGAAKDQRLDDIEVCHMPNLDEL